MLKGILTLTTVLICNFLFASDTLIIDPIFWHKDQNLRIVIVNKSLSSIKSSVGSASYILLDSTYEMNEDIQNINYSGSYQITGNDGVYNLYFTSLPIFKIGTTEDIVDEPKIAAHGVLTDTMGQIIQSTLGIEFRGGFSQTYPKKSYGIEFWYSMQNQSEKDVSFFNMREDGDWILMAMYKEPLRARNIVNHSLWQKIHQPYYLNLDDRSRSGISTVYIELIINDEYQGIYALTERIDRKQLRVKKFNGSLRGEIYKGATWDGTTFNKIWDFNNNSELWGGFELEHPKPDEIIDWTNFHSFVEFVVTKNDEEFNSQIENILHIDNAVDYFIFVNLMSATDNTGKNMFWAKYDKNHPYFIVPWDFDGTYGMVWDGSYDPNYDYILTNGLFDRLLADCSEDAFWKKLKSRWISLRSDFLTKDYIVNEFQQVYNYLNKNNVYVREELAWDEYISDYNYNINYLNDWIEGRIEFLDSYFDQICISSNTSRIQKLENLISIFPNPVRDIIYVQNKNSFNNINYSIVNIQGVPVLNGNINSFSNQINVSELLPGFYFIRSEAYSDAILFVKI